MRRGRDEDETTCSVGAETIQRAVEYPIPTALEPVWSAYNPCTTNELSQARVGRRSAQISGACVLSLISTTILIFLSFVCGFSAIVD
jgi:hypothetical protein